MTKLIQSIHEGSKQALQDIIELLDKHPDGLEILDIYNAIPGSTINTLRKRLTRMTSLRWVTCTRHNRVGRPKNVWVSVYRLNANITADIVDTPFPWTLYTIKEVFDESLVLPSRTGSSTNRVPLEYKVVTPFWGTTVIKEHLPTNKAVINQSIGYNLNDNGTTINGYNSHHLAD